MLLMRIFYAHTSKFVISPADQRPPSARHESSYFFKFYHSTKHSITRFQNSSRNDQRCSLYRNHSRLFFATLKFPTVICQSTPAGNNIDSTHFTDFYIAAGRYDAKLNLHTNALRWGNSHSSDKGQVTRVCRGNTDLFLTSFSRRCWCITCYVTRPPITRMLQRNTLQEIKPTTTKTSRVDYFIDTEFYPSSRSPRIILSDRIWERKLQQNNRIVWTPNQFTPTCFGRTTTNNYRDRFDRTNTQSVLVWEERTK